MKRLQFVVARPDVAATPEYRAAVSDARRGHGASNIVELDRRFPDDGDRRGFLEDLREFIPSVGAVIHIAAADEPWTDFRTWLPCTLANELGVPCLRISDLFEPVRYVA